MSRAVAAGRIGSRPFLAITAFLIAVIAGVLACTDGSPGVTGVGGGGKTADSDRRALRGNPYRFVGEEHNAQVDQTLRELSKHRRKDMKQADLCALLDRITREYLARKGKAGYDFRPHPEGDQCRGASPARITADAGDGGMGRTVDYSPDFSPAAIDMVNEIEAIVLNASSAADIASQMAVMDERAQATLTSTDAALVLAVSSVAVSSAAYWEASLDYWYSTYSQGGNPDVLPYTRASTEKPVAVGPAGAAAFDWSGVRAVGWMDVSGGVVGGIRGAFGGPGGILAGAASGAAYASIAGALGMIAKRVAETM